MDMLRRAHDNSERSTELPLVPVVLFDGGCPLCRREITHYRRLATAGRLLWVDIASQGSRLDLLGVTHADAMARMHVRGPDGCWQTGAAAFAELWAQLPGYRWLARLVRGLHLIPILEVGYSAFARWRLRRRCDDASCALPTKSMTHSKDGLPS